MKIDSALMFDPVKAGTMAAQLEKVGSYPFIPPQLCNTGFDIVAILHGSAT